MRKVYDRYLRARALFNSLQPAGLLRATEVYREFRLVEYWREGGNWGDFCRPLGERDFECSWKRCDAREMRCGQRSRKARTRGAPRITRERSEAITPGASLDRFRVQA